jgi:hypothetical protein
MAVQERSWALKSESDGGGTMKRRFCVTGVQRQTGEDFEGVIEAATADNAKVKAELDGVIVTEVVPSEQAPQRSAAVLEAHARCHQFEAAPDASASLAPARLESNDGGVATSTIDSEGLPDQRLSSKHRRVAANSDMQPRSRRDSDTFVVAVILIAAALLVVVIVHRSNLPGFAEDAERQSESLRGSVTAEAPMTLGGLRLPPSVAAVLQSELVAQADTQVETFLIGESQIRIPPPAGFHRISGHSRGIDQMLASGVPPTNRLVAAYGSPEDLADVLADELPENPRSFSIQVLTDLEKMPLP